MTKDSFLQDTFWGDSLAQRKGSLFDTESAKIYSYAELSDLAEHYILLLPEHRQLIAIKANNNIKSLAIYIAALRAGHIGLMLASDINTAQLNQLCEHYGINWLFEQGELNHLNKTAHIFSDELSLLLSTSGSTGTAKLVKLSQTNIQANCQAICEYLPITQSDIIVTSLPINYSFGLSILNSHLNLGSSIVLTDENILHKGFWQNVKMYQPSALYGVPFTFETLLSLKLARLPLKSIKYFAVAGGKLAADKVTQLATWCENNSKSFYVYVWSNRSNGKNEFFVS